ncbi:MAG: dCMP deaminase family protein [Dehalococcoidia bacterium]|nr:dCMP deaminase family protein [Dehalococcoidia bacterium]
MIVARPDSDEYLMALAVDVASRCNCRRTAVGAILARDTRVISTGYNGTVVGATNCIDGGCARCLDTTLPGGEGLDRCVCVHAEQNALLNAARFGVAVAGAECFTTHEPCLECTKALIQARVARVVYWKEYVLPNPLSQQVRADLRRYAEEKRISVFQPWRPGTTVLNLDARYEETRARLASYVAARAIIAATDAPPSSSGR